MPKFHSNIIVHDLLAQYDTDDEEMVGFQNFQSFLSLIDERNTAEIANGGSSIHGITKFCDLTQTEFEKNFLGYVNAAAEDFQGQDQPVFEGKNGDHFAVIDYSSDADYSYDWIDVATTPVRDQVLPVLLYCITGYVVK